jgi:hypothetical protein
LHAYPTCIRHRQGAVSAAQVEISAKISAAVHESWTDLPDIDEWRLYERLFLGRVEVEVAEMYEGTGGVETREELVESVDLLLHRTSLFGSIVCFIRSLALGE